MGWYGQMGTNNPLSASATHAGQQGPATFPDAVTSQSVQYAATPPAGDVVDRADKVWINTARANTKFYFGETGSATFSAANAINFGTPASVGEINIQPRGWTSDSAATGDVIFIYNSKRK